jgi:hypothetical protein
VEILEVGTGEDPILIPSVFEQALDRSMGACERCGRSLHGRYHIHHKDMNPYNNELSNLLVLCPNCHYEIEGPQLEEILSFYQ